MSTIQENLECVWDALHCHRDNNIPEETDPIYDDEWNSICEAMAHITESLGLKLNHDGDYVEIIKE